ncbi:hypothetical protein F5H01DRAFT_342591 [Linnemannia elongata]|nr:hypothetical protein F5H01DRAFT_342591 [Linnemannia elongata]
MDDPLPKKRGKKPACSNFYTCTFVGKNTRQIETHEREYHDPEPLLIGDDDDSSNHPPVKIYRDPSQGMYFSCLHPNCRHTSITRDSAGRHYRSCRLLHTSSKAASVISISSVVLRQPEESTKQRSEDSTQRQQVETRQQPQVETRQQPQVETTQQPPVETKERRSMETLQRRSLRQSPRQNLRLSPIPLRRHNVDQHPSSSRSAAPRSLPADSDLDHPPHKRTTTTIATASTSSPPASNTFSSSDATTTQLLATMSHLTNAVTKLSEHLDKRARRIEEMGGQMVWLADQLDDIRSYNTSLEVQTKSLRREIAMVERRMEDLVQDNRDVRGRMRWVRSDLGRLGSTSAGYR